MKHIYLLLLVLVLLVSCTVPSLAEGEVPENLELVCWNGFTAVDGEVLLDICDEYNKTNPYGTTIVNDIMEWGTFNEKLPLAIASNEAPDFVICSNSYAGMYVKNNQFRDLSDFWDFEGVDRSDFQEAAIEMGNYFGVQVGLPMQVITHYFYWDKDIFAEYGLDPETPPQSWEEIHDLALMMTDRTRNRSGFLLPQNSWITALYAIQAFGGDVINDETGEVLLDSPESLEAFYWMKDLYDNNVSPLDIDDNTYYAGNTAMWITGPWIIKGLRDAGINYGVCSVPAGPGGQHAQAIQAFWSIPVTTPEEKIPAIYEFIKYWTSTDVVKRWSMECGTPPYLFSTREDPEVAADETILALSDAVSYAKVIMKNLTVNPSTVWMDYLYPCLQEIADGGDVDAIVKERAEALRAKMPDIT